MEKTEREHITQNLPELMELTQCHSVFLAFLLADGVLSSMDVEELETIKNGLSRAGKLYKLLQTRENSFSNLKKALRETNQNGALSILNKCSDNQSIAQYKVHGSISWNASELIGKGCYHTKVFKGMFESMTVAVKKIMLEEETLTAEKVVREAKLLIAIDPHINIVRYFKAEAHEDFVLIALELCDQNLEQLVTKNPNLSDKLVILKEAAIGVEHLHSHRILHRDLKPANVLICKIASGFRVKIGDFGMSRMIPEGNSLLASSSTAFFGTVEWLAPELLSYFNSEERSSQRLRMGFAGDVFSLGCIFYYVLTSGKHPFGDSSIRRQGNILDGTPVVSEDDIKSEGFDRKEMLRLIREMIAHEETKRPTASKVVCHPVFSENKTEQTKGGQVVRATEKFEASRANVTSSFRRMEISDHVQPSSVKSIEEKEVASKGTEDKNGNSPLHFAAFNSDVKRVEQLLMDGARINGKNKRGRTPLHMAAIGLCNSKDFVETIKFLIQKGGDVNAKDDEGCTFLDRIFWKGECPSHASTFADMMELLSKHSAHLRMSPEQFHELSQFMIKKRIGGQLVTLSGTNAIAPLHLAVCCLDVDPKTLLLLRDNGVNFKNNRDDWGAMLLHYAVAGKRSTSLLNKIIELGVDEKKLNVHGENALHFSAGYGSLESLKYFLNLKTLDINQRNVNGWTPLFYAVMPTLNENCLAKTKLLAENGASWSIISSIRKRNILHMAAGWGSFEAFKYVLERSGLDVNGKDEVGATPLHLILWIGNRDDKQVVEKVRLILAKGARRDSKCNKGWTPLVQMNQNRFEEEIYEELKLLLEIK